jgi:transposase
MKKAATIKVFKNCSGIGIDVCKAECVVVGIAPDTTYIQRVPNQMKPLKAFIQRLHDSGYQGKLLCESTGHYHLKLAVICQKAGLPLIVLNPLQSSKHSKASVRKTKTDPHDGLMLATMCITEPHLPKPAQLTESNVLIRLKMGQIAAIEKQLQKMQQSLAQYEETYQELGLPLSDLQHRLRSHCNELKKLQRQLAKELEELLAQAQPEDESYTRLCTLPSYSNIVSGLVGQFDRNVKGAHSWTAYVGLDVSVRESGTWKGRGKLTKRGNAYIRKRLYQSAWGACLNYDYVRAYYDRLKAQGRKHVEAVCTIARKLLRIAYHVVVNKVHFDPKIAFAN